MKKLLLSASALALLALTSVPAQAECDGPYVALRGGIVKHGIDGQVTSGTDDSDLIEDERLMISGALGYRYEHWRGELEYVWRKHSSDTDDESFATRKFKSYSYMANMYYDIFPYHWWTPYVGAGIGLTKLQTSEVTQWGIVRSTDGNYKPMNFTWSVGAGLSLKVTNRFNVDLGYRYYDMNHIRQADIDAQEVYGGIRYVF
jgi:opacity protein-like surface antigen